MAAAFVGAKLGLVGTREVGASHNFSDVPDSAFYQLRAVSRGERDHEWVWRRRFCGENPVVAGQVAVLLKRLFDVVMTGACPPDSVAAGTVRLDKYEARWEVPPGSDALIQKIKARDGDAARAAGAGVSAGSDGRRLRGGLPGHGERLQEPLRGVDPRGHAIEVHHLDSGCGGGSERRQAPADERGVAGRGARDARPGAMCRSHPNRRADRHPGCVSDVGAFDMVGNLAEWVADWGLPAVRAARTSSGSGTITA